MTAKFVAIGATRLDFHNLSDCCAKLCRVNGFSSSKAPKVTRISWRMVEWVLKIRALWSVASFDSKKVNMSCIK